MDYLNLAGSILLWSLAPVSLVLVLCAYRLSAFWYTPLLFVVLLMGVAQLLRDRPIGTLFFVLTFLMFFGQSISEQDDEYKRTSNRYLPSWMRGDRRVADRAITAMARRQISRKPKVLELTAAPAAPAKPTKKKVGYHHPTAVSERTGELPVYGYDYVKHKS